MLCTSMSCVCSVVSFDAGVAGMPSCRAILPFSLKSGFEDFRSKISEFEVLAA